MAPITNETAKIHLVTCLADALRRSISTSRPGQWFCAASTVTGDLPFPPQDRDALAMRVLLRGTLRGELTIEIASKDIPVLFPSPDTEGAEKGALWQTLMDGMVEHLPKRAADTGVFAFSVESHEPAQPSGAGVQIGWTELIESDSTCVTLRVFADEELMESLQIADWSARTHATNKANELVLPELGRVIDVPLSVTLRFGQRNMRLREVLELNTGTLVELDRQVEEPVDLILDERVIARGEVVIVDGNYGLRVMEIVERHPMLVV